MVVYVPGYTGAAIPTGWPFLWVAIPFLLIWDKFRNGQAIVFTDAHWLGLAVIGWALLSLTWTPSLYGAVSALLELLVFAGTFAWVSSIPDARPIYAGMAMGLAVNAALALAQWFGFDWIGQTSVPAGLFVSKNVLGEISALLFVAMVGYRLWRWLPACLPGLLLTGARGAWLALFLAAVAWIWPLNRRLALGLCALPIIAIAFTLLTGHRVASLAERWDWAHDTFLALNIWGHGIGSFDVQFPTIADFSDTSIRRPDHLHNDYLEFAFEIGAGIVPAAFFLFTCLESKLETERLVFLGFLGIALFEMPMHVPAECFLGGVVAGQLARSRVDVRGLGRLGRSTQYGRVQTG
jgi:hypothetical protein